MRNREIFGGIEAGGTKFVCGIGSGTGELLARAEFPTTSPSDTIGLVVNFFRSYPDINAVGIGSFGPVNLDRHSSLYGTILNTPKNGWQGTNLHKTIAEQLGKPVEIVTDTDVAALGERYHGIGLHILDFVYLTIGTGIGGSILSNGQLLHGLSHPEIGHIRIPVSASSSLAGACAFHHDCLEGLASGKALEISYGKRAEAIADKAVWHTEAEYIALGLVNIINMVQPERIILGGSVMKSHGLIEQIRSKVVEYNNSYVDIPSIESYIVHSSSESIGVLGAIKLASL